MDHRSDSPGSRSEREGAEVALIRFLAGLPDRDREALLRYYRGGEEEGDVESALGLDTGRLRKLRYAAKAVFRKSQSRGG